MDTLRLTSGNGQFLRWQIICKTKETYTFPNKEVHMSQHIQMIVFVIVSLFVKIVRDGIRVFDLLNN